MVKLLVAFNSKENMEEYYEVVLVPHLSDSFLSRSNEKLSRSNEKLSR